MSTRNTATYKQQLQAQRATLLSQLQALPGTARRSAQAQHPLRRAVSRRRRRNPAQTLSETRRRHPLTNDNRSLAEAIAYESQLLAPITDRADLKIDTTRLNLYQLRDTLKLRLLGQTQTGTAFLVESFGFKRGMPVDADLVFDARCLPNPYWKPELRDHSGLDQPVIDYLAAQPEVEEMYQDILAYLENGYRVLPPATAPTSPLPLVAPAVITARCTWPIA